MRAVALLIALVGCTSNQVAYQTDLERQSGLIDSMRSEIARAQHTSQTEMEILADRFDERERALAKRSEGTLKQIQASVAALESRLLQLQERQTQAAADIRRLASHVDEKGSAIAKTRAELEMVRKQLASQVGSYKEALESMMAMVSQESRTYRVQRGDSLGEIASKHHVTIGQLKSANGLTSDTIFPDQELRIP